MKPILFNTEMVRAILEGRKTVTRRVIKPQPSADHVHKLGYCVAGDKKDIGRFGFGTNETGGSIEWAKPPYKVGDILYVRESYMLAGCRMCEVYECYGSCGCPDYLYKADFGENDLAEFKEDGYKWKPSIHMPKEAARIFLRVTDVRVERLQDITREQVHKEGIPSRIAGINTVKLKAETLTKETIEQNGIEMCHIDFANLWNSTIKKDQLQYYSWNANPYVWVIEFERIEKPAEEA